MPTITDWLMVGITLVYVVATWLILRANKKSADATRAQVIEAKRQYEEEHRAYITYEVFFERRHWYGIRFTNYGKRVAENVQIRFNQDFINSILVDSFRISIEKSQNKTFVLGIGQSHDFILGANELRNNQTKIEGQITYKDSLNSYCENFSIDFSNYADFMSVNSDNDILCEILNKQNEVLNKMVAELKEINLSMDKIYLSKEPESTDITSVD